MASKFHHKIAEENCEKMDNQVKQRKREGDEIVNQNLASIGCSSPTGCVKRKAPATTRTPFKSPLSAASRSTSNVNVDSSKQNSRISNAVVSVVPKSKQLGGLSKTDGSTVMSDPVALQAKILELRAKELQIDQEIGELEETGLDEKQLRDYMNQLHDYNDLKDAAQTTFGRLANIRQCMIRDVYKDLGLGVDD